MKAMASGKQEKSVASLAIAPLIVDVNDRSDDLLVLFRDRRVHFAIVQQNEQTVGIVTLEDVMEELVGEIEDEKHLSSPS